MCGVVRCILIYGLQLCMHPNASSVFQKKLKEVTGIQIHDNWFQRTIHSLLSFFVMLQSQAFIRSEECRQLFHLPPEEVSGVVILLRECFEFLEILLSCSFWFCYTWCLKKFSSCMKIQLLAEFWITFMHCGEVWISKKMLCEYVCYPPDNRWFECFVWVAGGYFPAM